MDESSLYSVCVGKFGSPHGVKGGIKLFSYTEDPESIFIYPLYLPRLSRRLFPKPSGIFKQGYIVLLDGFTSPEAVASLTGALLYTNRDSLPDIDSDDTYYAEDLMGASVENDKGVCIGKVRAFHNFGAGDILDVVSVKGKSFMLSFENDVIENIDLEKKVITLRDEC